MTTTKKASATKLPEGIKKTHVKKAIVTVQQVAPKASGKDKLKTALSLIALFSGIAGAVIPKPQVKAVADVIGATVAALQASGELVRDK